MIRGIWSATKSFNIFRSRSFSITSSERDKKLTVIKETNIATIVEREIASSNDPFYICNMKFGQEQLSIWKHLLPRVQPHYAVKCNPDPVIINEMASMDIGFDCASKNEISLVLEKGVEPSRIIFAHTCKQTDHVEYAKSAQVKRMTFDNSYELEKIKNLYGNSQLLLRIQPDDSKSTCRLSSKFGAPKKEWDSLLSTAKKLELDICGVAFHVGSGCYDIDTYVNALNLAKEAFDAGTAKGFNMRLVDIGGGYPGSVEMRPIFKEIANAISLNLDALFPGVEIISEPGRYFMAGSYTLYTQVTSKKKEISDNGNVSFRYYLNDGVYGSFNCIVFDYASVVPCVAKKASQDTKDYASSLWGPTCDSLDVIMKNVALPELEIGDWLKFENMGAYTLTSSSTFNGFGKPRIIYLQ